jgi:rRNA processing protein Krr1/Pno1
VSAGANIRAIVIQAGGSDDRRDLARTVRFPRQESKESTIQVEGDQAVVDKIVSAIESFVRQKESQTSQMVEVAPEKHRLLIGRDGETRRKLESQFGVSVDIPKLSQQGAARSQIKITGLPGDVERARAHIVNLVKEQESQTIQVPRSIHHAISDNGNFFRRLRNDYQVTVDHAGEQPPPKTAGSRRTSNRGKDVLPLITDEPNMAENYAWDVVDAGNAEHGNESIPWVLRGSTASLDKARTALEKAIQHALAHEETSTGYLVLPDPRSYRFIIGQGGSQINSIRNQTGCRITVPRDQAKGEAIEIVGSREGVEHAKDIILDVVQNGGKGGSGRRRD